MLLTSSPSHFTLPTASRPPEVDDYFACANERYMMPTGCTVDLRS